MKRFIFTALHLISCICLVAQTTKTYTLTFDREDFTIEDYNDGKIVTSSEHNIAFDEDITKPAIPYKVVNILLPENQKLKTFSFNISDTQTTTDITLSANPIYITTDSDSDSISYPQSDYPIQEYPLEVSLLGEQVLECYRYVSFRVPVFSYNAVSRTITWASRISLSIETEENPAIVQTPIRSDVITGILENILFNPEEIYEPTINASLRTATPSNSEDIKYLIVTSESLKSSFTPLANWKTIKGVKAKIVTVEEIYNEYATVEGTNQLKIKQCIYDYYTNGLEYVLLGGDETIIPVQKCYGTCTTVTDGQLIDNNIPTDLFYANLTGRLDWDADGDGLIGETTDNTSFIPNIAIGRFPVNISTQANLLVQRTLEYEKNPPTDSTWCYKLLLSGTSNQSYDNMEGKSENMYSTYIEPHWNGVNKSRFYNTATDFEGGSSYDVNPTNLQEQINRGYHHIHTSYHGLETLWWLERGAFQSHHANSLTNSTPTFIATIACFSNAFDRTESCLGESLLLAPNSGIISYLGASREGIDNMGTGLGPSSKTNGLFYEKILSTNKDIGTALKEAKGTLFSSYPNDMGYRWVLFALNLMGDPELQPYTNTPQYIKDNTLNRIGDSTFQISMDIPFYATITDKKTSGIDYFQKKYHHSDLSIEVPKPLNNYQLCIWSHNHIPIVITELGDIYIQNQTFTGDQSIKGYNIYIGSNVNDTLATGPVTIESGCTTFDAINTVTIKNDFECKKGTIFEIKTKKRSFNKYLSIPL